MSTLVVSAVKYEVEPFLEKAGSLGLEFNYTETGIGAIKAAQSSERLAREAKGKDVIYVGTCGIFGGFNGTKIIRANKTVWLPPCERASIAWSIEGIDRPIILPKPPTWANDLEKATVICSSTIAKSPQISDESYKRLNLNKNEMFVENLELYSCTEAITRVAKSFVAILGVSNEVNLKSRAEWKDNFKKLALSTSDYLLNKLSR